MTYQISLFLKKINYKQATTHFKTTITPFSPTVKTIIEYTLAGSEIFGMHTGSRENIQAKNNQVTHI